MRITYVHYEYVDEVMTLTLAEGPGESGTILHFLRATWEDADESHEVVNGSHYSVVGAVNAWRLSDSELSLTFNEPAASQLGVDQMLRLELAVAPQQVQEVKTRLSQVLVDVSNG